jgi:hypothetical protein
MTSGIIVILAALVPLVVQIIKARMAPQAEQTKTNEDIEKAVISGDTNFINTFLHDRLPNTSGSNIEGQGSKI